MRHRKNIFRDKSFMAMAGVSVLALVGIAAGVMLQNSHDEPETQYIADLNGSKNSDSEKKTNSNTENSHTNPKDDVMANNGASKATENTAKETSENITPDSDKETAASANTGEDEVTTAYNNSSEAGANVTSLHFSADSKLIWPVETTDIVMDFSPTATIYFATLDKYKTNDSVCIRSEADTPVYASTAGKVCDIGYNEETGNSLSLDLGDGYILQYGQIKDIQVSEDTVVSEGDLLCYVANPTKYYTVEGPNLYMRLLKDGTAVDPLDYLDYE